MTEIFEFAQAILLTMSRFLTWIPQHSWFLLDIAIGYLLLLVCFKVAKVVRLLFLKPSSPSTRLFIAAAKTAGPPNGMSKEAWISEELTKLPDIIAKAELEAEHEWRIENGEHEGCPKCAAMKKLHSENKAQLNREFGVPARLREPEPVGITDRLMREAKKTESEQKSEFKTKHKCINCHSPFWTTSGVGLFWPDERNDEQLKQALSGEWSENGKSVTFKRIPLRADPL